MFDHSPENKRRIRKVDLKWNLESHILFITIRSSQRVHSNTSCSLAIERLVSELEGIFASLNLEIATLSGPFSNIT